VTARGPCAFFCQAGGFGTRPYGVRGTVGGLVFAADGKASAPLAVATDR
jgi:hypothetical protein